MGSLKLCVILIIGLLPTYIVAQTEFITTWDINELDLSITLEADTAFLYQYTIDWGDGSNNINITSDITHTYKRPGNYQIIIKGTFPKIKTPDVARLTSIDQWGLIKWKSMRKAFEGAVNLSTITQNDAPNLNGVTDMNSMFRNCHILNSRVNHWDVSKIEDMSYMFKNAHVFNRSLSNWDVSKVVNMLSMFENAEAFNQDLSG